jgi:phenylalanyl-tRNA synthetase alpha chain
MWNVMSGPTAPLDPAPLEPAALDAALDAAREAFAAAGDLDALKAARLAHVDKGAIAAARREIGALPPAAKAEAGKLVGAALDAVRAAYTSREEALQAVRDERILVEERVDVTMPTARRPLGARHPIELTQERLADIFIGMGWEVADGPELESEWMNFDALNLGKDHPARQMQDTFFVDPPDGGLVLRTQTSPIQIRSMLTRKPPIYVVAPGKVFRTDDLDATHTPVFHQIELLAVDKGLTMAHLRGSLDHFVRAMFGDVKTRVRRPTSRSPSLPWRPTSSASYAVGADDACRPSAEGRAGSSSAGRGWSTARCSRRAGSTPMSTRASRSASASSAPCNCATA